MGREVSGRVGSSADPNSCRSSETYLSSGQNIHTYTMKSKNFDASGIVVNIRENVVLLPV